MPKITTVKSAKKDQGKCRRCGSDIRPGDTYFWFANLLGRTSIRKNFCSKCYPRRSETTTSEKLAQLYGAEEALSDIINKADCFADLVSALRDAASEAREVAESYQESVSNMPENLQQGTQAQEMEEKAGNCEEWADELESAADEIESLDDKPEPDAECGNCQHSFSEHEDGGKCSHVEDGNECECPKYDRDIEEARTQADEAASNLSL